MDNEKTLMRPMSFGTILDYAFKAYRKYFVPIFLFCLLTFGIAQFVILLCQNASGLQVVNTLDHYINTIEDIRKGFDESNWEDDYDFDDYFDGSYNEYSIDEYGENPQFENDQNYEDGYIEDDEYVYIDYESDLTYQNLAKTGDLILLSTLLALLMNIIVTPLVQGSIIATGEQFLTNGDITFKWLFKTGLSKFGRLILTTLSIFVLVFAAVFGLVIILFVLFISIGFSIATGSVGLSIALSVFTVLLILAGTITFFTFLSLTYPIVMFEDNYHFNAIFRSFKLVSKHFWKSLGVLVVVTLLVSILSNSFSIITELPFVPDFLSNNTVSILVQALVSVLVVPIAYIATSILYFDIRMRTEGYDIESRI